MKSFNKKENGLCELAWGRRWQDCHSFIWLKICSHTEWATLRQNSHLPLYSCCPLKCKNTIWIFINIGQQLSLNDYLFCDFLVLFFLPVFSFAYRQRSGHRSTELQPRICNLVLLLYCCISNCKMFLTLVNKLSIETSGLWLSSFPKLFTSKTHEYWELQKNKFLNSSLFCPGRPHCPVLVLLSAPSLRW